MVRGLTISIVGLILSLCGHAQILQGVMNVQASGPAPAFQSATKCHGSGNGSCAYGTNPTAGTTDIVFLWCYASTSCAPVSLTSTQAKTYTQLFASPQASPGWELSVWEADNMNAAAETVGFTITGNWDMIVTNYAYLAASAFDKTSTFYNGSTSTPTSNATATTTYPHELVIGAGSGVATISSAGTGFTLRTPSGSSLMNLSLEDLNALSTGAQTATLNTSLQSTLLTVATFKAAN